MASGRSSASSRWAPPCCAPGRPRRAQPGNRRDRPTPVMHTTHATASWRRGEKGGQQTLVAPFWDEHRTRPLTNLLPELRPGLLPESWPLTNLLPEPLTWGLTSYQALTWHADPEGALTGGVCPALTDLLPRDLASYQPLTSGLGLLPTSYLALLPGSYLRTRPLTWPSYLMA